MRILLDTCISGVAKAALCDLGHDVTWAAEWEVDPGDAEILTIAHAENRILVTLDKDFGELAIVHGIRHSGIVRLVGFRAKDQGNACAQILVKYETNLRNSALITATPNRVRVREDIYPDDL